jgi:lipopolysaccharide/colanic/teichoic acid biosynthesis glycosyltransferase
LAFVVAFNLRTTEVRNEGFSIPRRGTVIAIGIWVVSAWLVGAYESQNLTSLRRTLQKIVSGLALSLLGLLTTFFIIPYTVTRPTILLWVPIAFVLLLAARLSSRRLWIRVSLATPIIVVAPPHTMVLGVFFIPCAALIKATSPGPVFHRQLRVGKYGRPFRINKFRTMRVGHALHWSEVNDNRVTAVGKVLRKLHLDELPQGWNIIKGDMSVVGPRPEQPHYVTELRSQIDFYNSRLVVRPGLTGWAQINRGYSSGLEGARVKLSYDLYYIKHQSLSLDLLILVRTVFTLLAFQGL